MLPFLLTLIDLQTSRTGLPASAELLALSCLLVLRPVILLTCPLA